jgi:Ca2+-binding RTX toxin-like protein
VTVDLTKTGAQNTGGGGTDTLVGIENLYGSDFNDILTGDALANMMVGGKGDDRLSGGKGDDTLWGSEGNDTLDGGDGDDYLVGGAGDDMVKGGAGVDWSSYEDAKAGVRVDLALTGAQDTGGAGRDTLSGIENLYGSNYADSLLGDDKANYLSGGAGTDNLYGRGGDDHLSGGAGDDFIDGGDGFDVVSYDDGIEGGVYVDLRIPIQHTFLSTAHGKDRLISIEALWGSTGDDTFIGNASENYLGGNAGNDTLTAIGGHDTLDGGEGDDILISSVDGEGDLLVGGVGDDVLTIAGTQGLTILDGGEGSDTIRFTGAVGVTYDLSKTGLQTVAPGLTVDVQGVENAWGGDGDDHLIGDARDNVLSGGGGRNLLDGGDGSDIASYASSAKAVWVQLQNNSATLSETPGTPLDTFVSIEGVIGSKFDDQIFGSLAKNHLWGGAGNDSLSAWGGGDVLEGGEGNDVLSSSHGVGGDVLMGGAGGDTLISVGGGSQLSGGEGDDFIHLYEVKDDVVDGGDGYDVLSLVMVPDVTKGVTFDLRIQGPQEVAAGHVIDVRNMEGVFGTAGNDHLIGDAGDNLFSGGGGKDVIEGGDGVDTVSYAHRLPGVIVDLRTGVQSDLYSGAPVREDTLTSIENVIGSQTNDELYGDAKDNVLTGGGGDDRLDGGAGSDTASYFDELYVGAVVDLLKATQDTGHGVDTLISIENLTGSRWNDTLSGDAAKNVLNGGDGDDVLNGRGGDDILVGGKGHDVLTGGEGRDAFKFAIGDSLATDEATGAGVDVITDFQAADQLVFKTGTFAWSYAEKEAAAYAEAFGLAQERMATSEAGMTFTAVKVGGDVFVFAGEVTADGFALQNAVKLAGVGLDAVDYFNFLGG